MSQNQAPQVEQATGTTNVHYRAELYDEALASAHEMGYRDVSDALTALARIKTNPVAEGLRVASEWHAAQRDASREQSLQDSESYTVAKANGEEGASIEALLARWGDSIKRVDAHKEFSAELARQADALAAQAYVGLEHQPTSMDFTFRHPVSGEEFTVCLSREDIQLHLSNELYDLLGALVCSCQPVGETNVVECGCTDYLDDFALLPVPAPKTAGTVLPNRHGVDGHYFGKNLARLVRDFDSHTHDELARLLIRLANVADSSVIRESEFAPAGLVDDSFPILWAHRDAFDPAESAYTYHLQSKSTRGPGDIEVMRVSDYLARVQKDGKQ